MSPPPPKQNTIKEYLTPNMIRVKEEHVQGIGERKKSELDTTRPKEKVCITENCK